MSIYGLCLMGIGKRVVYSEANNGQRLPVCRDLSLAARFRAWKNGGSFWYGTTRNIAENIHAKKSFYDSIKETHGEQIVQKLLAAQGLSDHKKWIQSPVPLRFEFYDLIQRLAKKESLQCIENNTYRVYLKNFCGASVKYHYFFDKDDNLTSIGRDVSLENFNSSPLMSTFRAETRNKYWIGGGLPITGEERTALCNHILMNISKNPQFNKKVFRVDEIREIAQKAMEVYVASDVHNKTIKIKRVYQRISKFLDRDHRHVARHDLTRGNMLSEGNVSRQKGIADQVFDKLRIEGGSEFSKVVHECMRNLEGAEFSLMIIEEVAIEEKRASIVGGNTEILVAAWRELRKSLENQKLALECLPLDKMSPLADVEQDLHKCLIQDINDRLDLVGRRLKGFENFKNEIPWNENKSNSAANGLRDDKYSCDGMSRIVIFWKGDSRVPRELVSMDFRE